jgi:predicted DNA-binding transcriptional regulator AlpA
MGDDRTRQNPDDLLLLPEVADITRRSVDTLRWLRHKGEGPIGFRMGRRVVFRRGVVMDWIAQQEREQRSAQGPQPAA